MHRNISKVQELWRRLGKMSQLEGEDSRVSELLYRVVIQAVLLFDQEPWELPDTMM